MPRRRASIAARISAAAAGGALRYRASSSGAPARNWITCPVRRRPGRQHHPRVCCPGELAHLRRGERGGHGDVVPGQQLPRLRVRVGAPPAGRAVRVSQNRGPQGGQHQHRGPGGVAQQLPQPGGDPLAQPALGRVEVELGLVQPHHGPRPDARQLAQRRIGAGRVDRMPQPPRRVLVPQQGQGLPAGPGLARGGPADQHRDPAAARPPPPAPPRPSTWSCPRGTYAGSSGSPAGASSGCTGRCTSSANGSLTCASSRPAVGPTRACDPPGGLPASPATFSAIRPANCSGVYRRRSTVTTSGSSPGSVAVIEPGRKHVHPGLGHRPAERGAALQPGPVGPGVLGGDEHHHRRGLLRVDPGQLLGQVHPPQPDLLIGVVEAAHPPRLQRRSDLPHVVPLRPGERQRHIPPPPWPGIWARAAIPSRHATRVCHQPDLQTSTRFPATTRRPGPVHTSTSATNARPDAVNTVRLAATARNQGPPPDPAAGLVAAFR